MTKSAVNPGIYSDGTDSAPSADELQRYVLDPTKKHREEGILSLRRVDSRKASQTVDRLLTDDSEPASIQVAALRCIETMGPHGAMRHLAHVRSKTNSNKIPVACAALRVLALVGEEADVRLLRGSMDQGSSATRRVARFGYNLIGHRYSINDFEPAMHGRRLKEQNANKDKESYIELSTEDVNDKNTLAQLSGTIESHGLNFVVGRAFGIQCTKSLFLCASREICSVVSGGALSRPSIAAVIVGSWRGMEDRFVSHFILAGEQDGDSYLLIYRSSGTLALRARGERAPTSGVVEYKGWGVIDSPSSGYFAEFGVCLEQDGRVAISGRVENRRQGVRCPTEGGGRPLRLNNSANSVAAVPSMITRE